MGEDSSLRVCSHDRGGLRKMSDQTLCGKKRAVTVKLVWFLEWISLISMGLISAVTVISIFDSVSARKPPQELK